MSLIEKAKRDFKKHPAKAGALGVLFLVMVFFGVKMVFDLKPNAVAAASSVDHPVPVTPVIASTVSTSDAEERLEESGRLWKVLLYVKPSAIPAEVAFSFDSRHYDVDPSQQRPPINPEPSHITPVAPAPVQVPVAVDLEAQKLARIRDGARSLIIKSILVGSNTSKPVVIINQQLLTVGHEINGYVITAIRSREVDLIKEGVPVVLQMRDELRGQ